MPVVCCGGPVTPRFLGTSRFLECAGLSGPALQALVLVSKYCDHLPLHRQSDIYAHSGVEIERFVMTGWVVHMAALLESLAEQIAYYVRAG